MSYIDAERSIAAARHARLYQIERSTTTVWRYTSADRAITWGGYTWEPLAISDDGVRMTGEASADEIKITLPYSTPVVQLYRVVPPSEEVFVTIYDYDAGEADALVAWVGSISAMIAGEPGSATLACDSLSTSMRRDGLRLKYERACPHSVYDHMCGVNKALYAMPVKVTAMDGVSITVARNDGTDVTIDDVGVNQIQVTAPDPDWDGGRVEWDTETRTITAVDTGTGWITLSGSTGTLAASDTVRITKPLPAASFYDYGAAEWPVDGTTEMRGIDSSTGAASMRLIGGTYGLAVNDEITLYPGCDGTRAMCDGRFNNLLNHGGFPHMPGESIYGKRLW